MQRSAWRPCPRCASVRVRYRRGPQLGWAALLGAGALGCLVFGTLMPCLWLGFPLCALGIIVLLVQAGPDWHCADCQATWPGPPP